MKQFALKLASVCMLVSGSIAHASAGGPEETGLAVFAGYSSLDAEADQLDTVKLNGAALAARTAIQLGGGGFIKSEFHFTDTRSSSDKVKLKAQTQETRAGFGYGTRFAGVLSVYAEADYLYLRLRDSSLSNEGLPVIDEDYHGFFAGAGASLGLGPTTVYVRGGHLKNYGAGPLPNRKGNEAILGFEFQIGKRAHLLVEGRHYRSKAQDATDRLLVGMAGVKFLF